MGNAWRIKVRSGQHARMFCPVRVAAPADTIELRQAAADDGLYLESETGQAIPVQTSIDGEQMMLHFIVHGLRANEEQVYWLTTTGPKSGSLTGVLLKPEKKRVGIFINDQSYSYYVFDSQLAKPYLGPIQSPHGVSYTRLDFETKEHPHHRSVWAAIGDVNGVDTWNEPQGRFGRQLHQAFSELTSGPVFGRIGARNTWTNFSEKPLVDEDRSITVYAAPLAQSIVDIELCFSANYGQVEFGATKEAGPLGIRVNEEMTVKNGGTMRNAYGAISEAECWGKRAPWCDYYGTVSGHQLGIAAYDHPENERYPTHWHIRDYGLMAPNNFYFSGGLLLKPGETLRYRYRLYFHVGDTESADVSEFYHNYVNPPQVEFEA